MNKFIVKHLEWESEPLFMYWLYTALTPIGVLVVQEFPTQDAVVYWKDEQPLYRKANSVKSGKELAEFMFTERLFECFKTSKGFQEEATIEYEEALEKGKEARRVMIIGTGSTEKELRRAIGGHLGFFMPPTSVVDSNMDMFSPDCEITISKSFADQWDHLNYQGVPKEGKSMHSVGMKKIVIDSISKEEPLPEIKQPPIYEERKSKYINKPQRNWRKH